MWAGLKSLFELIESSQSPHVFVKLWFIVANTVRILCEYCANTVRILCEYCAKSWLRPLWWPWQGRPSQLQAISPPPATLTTPPRAIGVKLVKLDVKLVVKLVGKNAKLVKLMNI